MLKDDAHRLRRRRMRCASLFLGGLVTTLAAVAQDPPAWTLADALESAAIYSPALRARRAVVDEVASGLRGAEAHPYNPELSLEVADRRGPGGSTTDRGLNLTQEIEIAGQRAKRMALAQGELEAAEASWSRELWLSALRIESAFVEAIRARELLDVAEIDAKLAREILDFSQRRLERGAATQIEVNLGQAAAGRTERSVQRERSTYFAARSRLAELAGADPAAPPEPLGDLLLPQGDLPLLADLMQRALDHRGDLRAARRLEEVAEEAIRLALAERRPNLVLGGFFRREEATDDIFGATVGISLPLLNRNQGAIAEARAIRERRRHEQESMRLAIRQEVATALSDLRAARAAAEHLRDQVLETLEENVDLLQRSFAAGRIGATDVVTLRRELVAGRREYVEALADAWLARIQLDLSVGGLAVPRNPLAKELP